MKSVIAAIVLGASTVLAGVPAKRASLPTVSVKGNAFFAGNERFYIRGVDYQPGGASDVKDPIADAEHCKRDIAKFQELGINTIRIYTVDNSANHDECMNALADAGIYLILDLNTPLYSLRRDLPKPTYNTAYLQNIFATVDAFHSYDNTLAFFSGNEVINDEPTSAAAPWVKAVTRDIRQYIRNRGYRTIPVGYSAADVSENRFEMAQYMNCGSEDERSDFFAFNDYSWCDPSSFTTSGWSQKVEKFKNYGIPLFLSEYGCNKGTREFNEVASLYSTDMTGVYSGGLVYEYSQEPNNYGLVEISDDGSLTELPDFQTLMNQFKSTANPQGDGGYNSTGGASGCPAYSEPAWLVKDDVLPAIPEGAKKFMTEGAGPGVGLSGLGSHDAGGESTGDASAGSGAATRTGSSSSASAAGPRPMAEVSLIPVVLGCFVAFSSALGAVLL